MTCAGASEGGTERPMLERLNRPGFYVITVFRLATTSTRGNIDIDYPVILITGALSGIGRATAAAFAGEGVCLVVSGHRIEARQILAAVLGTPWPQGTGSYYL
jgi:hypothetical protein